MTFIVEGKCPWWPLKNVVHFLTLGVCCGFYTNLSALSGEKIIAAHNCGISALLYRRWRFYE
jgi:hypothetical protein